MAWLATSVEEDHPDVGDLEDSVPHERKHRVQEADNSDSGKLINEDGMWQKMLRNK